jgi:two-component system, LytTR family, sensor kinase
LLAKCFPLTRRRWWRVLLIHLALSVAVAVVAEMLFAVVTPLLGLRLRPTILDTFRFVLPLDLHLNVALYWAIIGVQHAFTLHRSAKARETQAAQLELRTSVLERQLVESRLEALRMQLHPHFLFNTLNAITVLVRQSRLHEADEMLTNLSDLLRHTLREWENPEIPLRNEIEFLRLYLDIERVRFQDRLSVDMALEPDTLEALVPTFLLQPLVENAIRHGVARSAAAGNVTLRSRRMDAMLELQVGDDGPGLGTADGEIGTGLGLTNTRARLHQLYGSQQSLRLENGSPGTLATIQIPYRLEIDHLP